MSKFQKKCGCIEELFNALGPCLPWKVVEKRSKRSSSWKFAHGKRIVGFLNFLRARHPDVHEIFSEPCGFQIGRLRDLYDTLNEYVIERCRQRQWVLDLEDATALEQELQKLISKCLVQAYQRLRFLALRVLCLATHPLRE